MKSLQLSIGARLKTRRSIVKLPVGVMPATELNQDVRNPRLPYRFKGMSGVLFVREGGLELPSVQQQRKT